MKIYRYFLKLTIKKNYVNYMQLIMSTVIALVIIMISVNLMEIMKNDAYQYMHYKISGSQVVIITIGVVFILRQYYKMMKINNEDYSIIKVLGASQLQILHLIMIQNILLIILTLPLGLIVGFKLTHLFFQILFEATVLYRMTFVDISYMCKLILLLAVPSIIINGFILCNNLKRKLPLQIMTGK